MLIVSFDIASKSLAMSIIDFDDNYLTQLNEISTKFRVDIKNASAIDATTIALDVVNQLANVYDNIFNLRLIDVVDLIPGKKVKNTTSMLRSTRLAGYLQQVDKVIEQQVKIGYRGNEEIKIFLEYQMSANFKSNFIFSQIMGHFSNKDYEFKSTLEITKEKFKRKYDVVVIKPSLKNKLNLDKDKDYSYFMGKYAKKQSANKAHAKANLLYWLKQHDKENIISGIKKGNIDDVADSVTQALAWIIYAWE